MDDLAGDPSIPVLTQKLASRIEQAAVVFGRLWLGGIAGLHLGAFGPRLLVGCHPDRPELDFQNRVNGLTPADVHRIGEIGNFYDEHGVRPWWEIVPDDDFGHISAALTARGAAQIGFHAMTFGRAYGRPVSDATIVGPADLTTVEDDETFATYAHTRMQAHDLPPEVIEPAAADLRGWNGAVGVTNYLATVDGAAAGTAALLVHDGIGYLADATTLPGYRGRGIQQQLILERRAAAARAGCDLVCSQATFASTSHRNLQRLGLTGGFTKVVWR